MGRRCQSVRHFTLEHTNHNRNQGSIFQDLENDLRGYVVREIPNDGNRRWSYLTKIEFQKVSHFHFGLQGWVILPQQCNYIGIDLRKVKMLVIAQMNCKDSFSRTYFEHRLKGLVRLKKTCNFCSRIMAFKEMLTVLLFMSV